MSWKLRLMLALLLAALSQLPALAQDVAPASQPTTDEAAPDQSRFLRFTGDAKNGGKLETSEVTLTNDAGVKVRLISAVHIGEASYYHELQKSFESSDAVLYEMVSAKDSGPPVRGQHSDSGVSKLQNFLKDQLGLSFQLDEIDYTPKNFIHADLDAETFYKLQSDRGESFASLILKSMLNVMADPSVGRVYDDEPTDLVDFMTRPDAQSQLKLLFARRIGDIEPRSRRDGCSQRHRHSHRAKQSRDEKTSSHAQGRQEKHRDLLRWRRPHAPNSRIVLI